jgi:undecaprenyl diphosphate synthase
MIDSDSTPQHIGYILDGNRRWAKKHGLPTYEGHLAGYNALKDIIEATANAGVKYISFYTFSTQNWARAEGEVRGIMRLIRRLYKTDIKQLTKEGFRLVIMGAEDNIPADIQEMGRLAEQQSRDGTRATLVMCFNYGGQEEIVRAARRLVVQGIQADKINLESVSAAMDYPEIPACDLIVRTSGEQRLSDFMLWRSAYSELMFLDKYWPEMTKDDVADILKEYSRRIRRFGG